MRSIVRPVTTIALIGTLCVIALLLAAGAATLEDAKEAAAIIGFPAGVVATFWFKDRPAEKAADAPPVDQPDPRGA
jgi:hypothetical protein